MSAQLAAAWALMLSLSGARSPKMPSNLLVQYSLATRELCWTPSAPLNLQPNYEHEAEEAEDEGPKGHLH